MQKDDLISRQAALDALREKVFHELTDEFYGAMQVLDELPPVDAATVKRGRWIRDEFGSRCERCGLYVYRDKSGRPWESDYCPYCGADMRGERHDVI